MSQPYTARQRQAMRLSGKQKVSQRQRLILLWLESPIRATILFMGLLVRSLVFVVIVAAALAGCNAQPPRSDPIEVITGGSEVDISKHLAAGKITLVEFYAEWCGPCKMISPALEKLAKTDSDIALCKIDIVNWTSAVSRQYGVHSIPCVVVFDRKGQFVGIMKGVDPAALNQYITQAKGS